MNPLLLSLSLCVAAGEQPTVLVVVGAQGTDEYGKQFREWARRWEHAAERGQAQFAAIGLDNEREANDRDVLREALAAEATGSRETLWLVLIGHGTFDGRTAKFNLRGPDVSAAELAQWLRPLERPLAVINCASASGPFVNELSAPNRVVIAATKSGHEHNFARLGDYLSAAIAESKADLDKDGQTSLLEAFLLGGAEVDEYYEHEARLATEHALLDDNGDRLGTPAAWFKGVRAVKAARNGASPDGLLAHQFHLVRSAGEQRLSAEARSRRDELERDIAKLRGEKARLAEDEYFRQLEPLLVELTKCYESAEESDAQ
jgi:hypothetical protein